MAQTPPSHKTNAPASNELSWLDSLFKVTVRPLFEIALPLIYKLCGRRFEANFNNWDLPSPGSPRSKIWLLYLKFVLGANPFEDPPIKPSIKPALTISWP